MFIGHHHIDPPVILAPMAGITDKPFRRLCRRMGAGLAVSEMTTADRRLWHTSKSRWRMDHSGEPAPISIQIAGHDPQMLAEAARHNVALGADIIDINMGCPAKKVCNVAAGSALLRDTALVGRILEAVVAAVEVPVTLKIRTGYTAADRNALSVARIAEAAGIAALAIHGRTREDRFRGEAEHATAAEVKASVGIPVIINGDIASLDEARTLLDRSGADAVMIGRAAQGRPWLFRELAALGGRQLPPLDDAAKADIICEHIGAMHAFYGDDMGLRIARKHLGWYAGSHARARAFRAQINRLDDAAAQRQAVRQYFSGTLRQAA